MNDYLKLDEPTLSAVRVIIGLIVLAASTALGARHQNTRICTRGDLVNLLSCVVVLAVFGLLGWAIFSEIDQPFRDIASGETCPKCGYLL